MFSGTISGMGASALGAGFFASRTRGWGSSSSASFWGGAGRSSGNSTTLGLGYLPLPYSARMSSTE